MMSNEFTILFKILRANNNLTINSLAELTGLSSSYLRDLENGNRSPNKKVATSLIKAYNLNASERRILFDSIAHANNCLPYDVEEYLLMHREVVSKIISEMERPAKVAEENKVGFGSR